MWSSLKFRNSEEKPKSTQFKLENSRFFFPIKKTLHEINYHSPWKSGVYHENIASLSITAPLANATKIKTIAGSNRASCENINRDFYVVFCWGAFCIVLWWRWLLLVVKSLLVSLHITAFNNCTQLPEHRTRVFKQFLPAFFQISSGTYPEAGLWRNSRCASIKRIKSSGERRKAHEHHNVIIRSRS